MGSCNSLSKTKNSIRAEMPRTADTREYPRDGFVKIKK